MLRPHGLHPGFERLIGAALIDERTARRLLADPVGTALAEKLPAKEAARLAGIRAGNLADFARAVRCLAYGEEGVWEEYCLPSVG
jgi:hypothetical protein